MNQTLDQIIAYLDAQKGRLPTVAKETGLGLEWLRKLVAGHIQDPGVSKIEKLRAYMNRPAATNTPLAETALPLSPLTAVSALEGRYAAKTAALRP